MLRKSLFILLVASCSTSSFAFSPFNKIEAMHKKSLNSAIHKKTTTEPVNYTDFSGTWVGKCSDADGDEHELETVTIKNDDMSISFNKETYSFGALQTNSHSHSWNTFFDHKAFFWNTEKNQIIVNDVSVDKSHFTDNPYGLQQILTNISNITISIENEELITKGTVISFSDIKQENTYEFICTFKKEVY
jgi:hypothetical protein